MAKNSDNYIRKPIVFNRKSAWHMEILSRIESESENFSSYCMSILARHFDSTPKKQEINVTEIKKSEPQQKEVRQEMRTMKSKENGMNVQPKLFNNSQK